MVEISFPFTRMLPSTFNKNCTCFPSNFLKGVPTLKDALGRSAFEILMSSSNIGNSENLLRMLRGESSHNENGAVARGVPLVDDALSSLEGESFKGKIIGQW